MKLILLAGSLISCINLISGAVNDDSSYRNPRPPTRLTKTNMEFLNELPETASSGDENLELNSKKRIVKDKVNKPKTVLPLISELENESESDPKIIIPVPLSQSLDTNLSGPSEEDRLIDDKLKFLFPYYEIYEKLGGPSDPFKHFLFILILSVLLSFLFYLMYSISSDYLTPSLAHLSSACRMSPDMAGLTFLAFGNGAPDLFTALLGAEDAPEMILGSSIGSGLFIFTVVFGLVIIFAKDPTLPTSNSMILSFPSPKDTSNCVKIGRGTFWRNSLMYSGCVLALAIFVIRRSIPIWQPLILIIIFFIYLISSISAHYFLKPSKKQPSSNPSNPSNKQQPILLEQVSVDKNIMNSESEDPINGSMQLLEIERRRYKLQQLSLFEQFKFAFIEVTEWREMGNFGKCFWLLTSPVRLILNLTILPLPDPTLIENAPDRLLANWFISRFLITLNPFGSVLLLGWLSGFGEIISKQSGEGTAWIIFIYCSMCAFLILMFHLGSASISNPLAGSDRNWKTCLPLWLATIYSFTCCIGWIFAVSNELVAALSSLGLILGVSRSIMGCLVLAWGNSIGDLIADLALARNGAPQTAITAIFSGPVQNVLLTIGISFMAAAVQSPNQTILISKLRGDVHLSLALLGIVICSCLILIPGYFKYRIPRQFGVFLILLYVIYVPFSIWLGINNNS